MVLLVNLREGRVWSQSVGQRVEHHPGGARAPRCARSSHPFFNPYPMARHGCVPTPARLISMVAVRADAQQLRC